MAAKAWIRSPVREDKRLTEDRKSLIERYMIDAAEAQARAQRAAEEKARRAAEEEARRAAEEEARRAAEEAKRVARADAAATRTPPAAQPPVADLPVAAVRPAEPPVVAPPLADEAPAAAEIAEPREQAEAEPGPATRLPIYRWFDPPAEAEDAPDLSAS